MEFGPDVQLGVWRKGGGGGRLSYLVVIISNCAFHRVVTATPTHHHWHSFRKASKASKVASLCSFPPPPFAPISSQLPHHLRSKLVICEAAWGL